MADPVSIIEFDIKAIVAGIPNIGIRRLNSNFRALELCVDVDANAAQSKKREHYAVAALCVCAQVSRTKPLFIHPLAPVAGLIVISEDDTLTAARPQFVCGLTEVMVCSLANFASYIFAAIAEKKRSCMTKGIVMRDDICEDDDLDDD